MSATVEAEGLSYSYGRKLAVDNVTFSVAEGEWFALLGPNGAGKTTLLHMLTTMLRPAAGQARVGGFNTVTQARKARSALGMVFQTPALDAKLSAVENLRIHATLYGVNPRDIRAASEAALEWAGLAEVARRQVGTMSGGMKRRLELARTLMHEPSVLFMDEPTTALDAQGRRDLWARIHELRERGLTIVMTTHYLPEAEVCDRVAIMDQGRLAALDTPDALKRSTTGNTDASLEDVFFHLTGRSFSTVDEPLTAAAVNESRQGYR